MTTDLSPSGIQRLMEMAAKASSGWRSMRDGNQYIGDRIVGASRVDGLPRPWNPHYVVPPEKLEEVSRFVDEDADFIEAARTAFPDALRELSASRERIAALEAAIRWALGEGDSDFGDNKPTNLGPFWWRIELSRRARLSGGVGE